jgi:hypothetical protein
MAIALQFRARDGGLLRSNLSVYGARGATPSAVLMSTPLFSMRNQRAWGFWGKDADGRRTQSYNEGAFRYFLSVEHRRSERSNRPFALLLIDLKKQPGASDSFEADVADELFAGLTLCLRETDFLGWYREGRIAGAVLTQLSESSRSQVTDQLLQRISEALSDGFVADCADRLRMRIFHLPAQAQELVEDQG